jgi:hypothetical protein
MKRSHVVKPLVNKTIDQIDHEADQAAPHNLCRTPSPFEPHAEDQQPGNC